MKERTQNPVIGDLLKLRLFTYNSNQRQDVFRINDVKLYYLDPANTSEDNPDGRRLVKTITEITHEDDGQYSVTVNLEEDVFVIGKYRDVWEVEVIEDQPVSTIEQKWQILPNLWYTSPEPMIYDFAFGFRPNRLRAGSKQYLIVTVQPNVPTASDLERYYLNLAVASPIKISIEAACSDCLPPEQDLRLIVDRESIELRKACEGYYFLDTDTLELDCGIYNVWFEMEFGENLYISDKQQLEIYS
jgi:hypothetical protein